MQVLYVEARVHVLAPTMSAFLPPPARLLEQTACGVRRWIGVQVVRHVIALLDQVETGGVGGSDAGSRG